MVVLHCHRCYIQVRGIPQLTPCYFATSIKTPFVPTMSRSAGFIYLDSEASESCDEQVQDQHYTDVPIKVVQYEQLLKS